VQASDKHPQDGGTYIGPVSSTREYVDQVDRIQAEWRRARPDLDVSPHGVVGRVLRLASLQTERFSAVYREFGLTPGEFEVLAALRRVGEPFERAPSELATFTMVTTGAMTKRVDSLERSGFITRRPSASDRRSRVVALTQAGRDVIDRAFTEHVRAEHRMLDDLTADQVGKLEELLSAWLSATEQSADAHGAA
jgi:DNA-binding MarR family transcriptional regulator